MLICIANEGPVRIQYKCLVPIYVFPEMTLLFPKQNYNVLSPRSHTHMSVRDFYISRINLPILLQEICGPILGLGIYKLLTDTCMCKLGLRARNSQKRNTYMRISLQCDVGVSKKPHKHNLTFEAPYALRKLNFIGRDKKNPAMSGFSCLVLYRCATFTLRNDAIIKIHINILRPFFWSCIIFQICKSKAKIFQFNVNLLLL